MSVNKKTFSFAQIDGAFLLFRRAPIAESLSRPESSCIYDHRPRAFPSHFSTLCSKSLYTRRPRTYVCMYACMSSETMYDVITVGWLSVPKGHEVFIYSNFAGYLRTNQISEKYVHYALPSLLAASNPALLVGAWYKGRQPVSSHYRYTLPSW